MKINNFLTVIISAALSAASLAAAQGNDGSGSNIRVEKDPETGEAVIYEFRRETPAAMREPEVEPAFNAPAPASAPEPEPEPASEPQRPLMPINEITVIERAAQAPADSANTAAPKKQHRSVGARVAFGNIVNLGGSVRFGRKPEERVDLGVNFGFLGNGKDGFRTWAAEAVGFYEWTFGITDDKALSFFVGPGAALGWYGSSGDTLVVTGINTDGSPQTVRVQHKDGAFSAGVGCQLGIEVDFGFIDPEHSLYNALKDAAVTLDARPMFYLPITDYSRAFMWTVGISFRYRF